MSSPKVNGVACTKCEWTDFQPAAKCPRCFSDVAPREFNGVGSIVTFTTIRYAPQGFEDQVPYVVAIVDLQGGPRVVGRVSSPVDEVKIGDSVTLRGNHRGALDFQVAD